MPWRPSSSDSGSQVGWRVGCCPGVVRAYPVTRRAEGTPPEEQPRAAHPDPAPRVEHRRTRGRARRMHQLRASSTPASTCKQGWRSTEMDGQPRLRQAVRIGGPGPAPGRAPPRSSAAGRLARADHPGLVKRHEHRCEVLGHSSIAPTGDVHRQVAPTSPAAPWTSSLPSSATEGGPMVVEHPVGAVRGRSGSLRKGP